MVEVQDRTRRDHTKPELEAAVELALDKIESAIDRAVRISRNFLRFARAPDALVRDIDLDELASEIRDLMSKTAADANIEITTSAATNLSVTLGPLPVAAGSPESGHQRGAGHREEW